MPQCVRACARSSAAAAAAAGKERGGHVRQHIRRRAEAVEAKRVDARRERAVRTRESCSHYSAALHISFFILPRYRGTRYPVGSGVFIARSFVPSAIEVVPIGKFRLLLVGDEIEALWAATPTRDA